MNIKSSIVVLLSFFICNELQGQNTNRLDQAGVDFFETKIRPVLVDHCYKCHSADSKIIKGGLRVDSRQALIKGGDSGSSIVLGDPTKSLLIKALKYDGLEMPPKGRLSDSVIKDFETWIKMGAPDPRKLIETPIVRILDIEAGRKHWAFQPILDPKPPLVKDAAWPLDPLDRFLLAKLEKITRPRLGKRLWIGYWVHMLMENAGQGIGWILPVTQT